MASGDPGLEDIEYLSLPYLMRGMENYEFILNGPIGEEWNRTLADTRHVRLLGLLPRSARQISANRIVRSMADLEGLRLRVPKRDYYIQSLAAFGARPTPMAFAETYMGLQTGVVDGLENPIETLYAQRYYEVQKSILMVEYIMKPAYLMIGAPFWRSLSEPERTLFHSAANAARDVVVELLPEQEKAFLAEMEAAGIVVTYPDKHEFVAATRQVREDLGKKRWGAELYETIYEIGQRVL